MDIHVPLDKMTVEEKLRLMEEIWADLSRNPDDIPIPEWHLQILREREQLVKEGKAKYLDLDEAMKEVAADIERTKELRRFFHGEIERLPLDRLTLLHRVLLQLQLSETTDALNENFDRDRRAGEWSEQQIAEAIRVARAEHKYA